MSLYAEKNSVILLTLLSLLILILSYFGPVPALVFQRTGIIEQGQWWRLLSAHWVHAGVQHGLLNIASLVTACLLMPKILQPLKLLGGLLFCSIGIGSGLLLFNPVISYYAGFSGLFYALLGFGVILSWPSPTAKIILSFLVIKTLWEQSLGALPYSSTMLTGKVATAAHLYGTLCGIAWGSILKHIPAKT